MYFTSAEPCLSVARNLLSAASPGVLCDRLWRGAGLALPVFSARTHNSVGCGEFLDLMPLVEFADAVGMRLLQVINKAGLPS